STCSMRTSIRGSALTDRVLTSVPQAAIMANPWVRAARHFARQRVAVAGLAGRLLAIVSSGAAPWLSPHDPNLIDVANPGAPPTLVHPLGTDELGRDIV